MTKYVILLTDAHEPPAQALLEALLDAGLPVFVEGLRDLTAEVAALSQAPQGNDDGLTPPLAVLYEVVAGADTLEIHAAIEHSLTTWRNVPLVACRPRPGNRPERQFLRPLDSAALKRMGFQSVADDPAQVPALLRELEEQDMTGELQPTPPAEIDSMLPGTLLLPAKLKPNSLRAAFEMVASLHFTHDQKSAGHTALAGLSAVVAADRWTIYLTTEDAAGAAVNLEPLAVRGLTASERENQHNSELRRALLGDEFVLSGAESKAARECIASLEITRKTERGRRVVALPLVSGEKLMGVLEGVREGKGVRAFTRRDVALLGALALPVAYALGNSLRIAEAERLSLTDDLTKLHNARYLRQYLLSEIKRARRYGTSCAALFFDLDDFKLVNDLHGHLVGSHVLMEMAAIILSSVRDTDVVARYGGDEFVVVLPESNTEQAAFVAERVREKIVRHVFTGGRGLRLSLTASFGLATFPQHAQSPQQLVASADAAMYEAKAAGKNCVRFAAVPPDIFQNEKVIS